eukprot:NODE_11_length_54881_cov_1.430718.p39 type:complete len:124 gc:universal NODE_11_length_54881_cov_1.430718:30131-30502(+)
MALRPCVGAILDAAGFEFLDFISGNSSATEVLTKLSSVSSSSLSTFGGGSKFNGSSGFKSITDKFVMDKSSKLFLFLTSSIDSSVKSAFVLPSKFILNGEPSLFNVSLSTLSPLLMSKLEFML